MSRTLLASRLSHLSRLAVPLSLAAATPLVMGCSEGVPPPAAGAVQVVPGQSKTQPTMNCGLNTSPVLAPDGATGWNTDPKQVGRIRNGENGASVSCTVKKAGDGYTLKTSVHVSAGMVFSLNGTITGLTGTGTASIYTPSLGAALSTPTGATPAQQCTLDMNGKFVSDGAIWASYDCPDLQDPPSHYCSAHGIIIFENCEK